MLLDASHTILHTTLGCECWYYIDLHCYMPRVHLLCGLQPALNRSRATVPCQPTIGLVGSR
jgi:hypothetical protein